MIGIKSETLTTGFAVHDMTKDELSFLIKTAYESVEKWHEDYQNGMKTRNPLNHPLLSLIKIETDDLVDKRLLNRIHDLLDVLYPNGNWYPN